MDIYPFYNDGFSAYDEANEWKHNMVYKESLWHSFVETDIII